VKTERAMNKPAEKTSPRLQIDVHHCQLSPAEIARLEADVEGLMRQVATWPVSDLHVLIEYNARNTDFSVKTSLILDGATLVASDHDLVMHAAFLRCLNSLTENIRAYKDRLGQVPERQRQQKGTAQDVFPGPDPDLGALNAAVGDGDYAAFRTALLGYEEPLRKRVGRWVERYPDVSAQIGRRLEVADIVEEVFLTAFEGYEHRPAHLRMGEWLEGLIDQAVKTLQASPEEELENINLARSAVAATHGREAV